MTLAVAGLVRARWTDTILEEWIRNLLENRPDLTRERLERTKAKMIEAIPDSLVEISATLSEQLELPDPDDRHVLAAAIQAEAQVIVTMNVKDFPSSVLGKYDVETRTPDAFIAELLNNEPLAVLQAVKGQRERLKNPPQSVDEFLSTLKRQGLIVSVSLMEPYRHLL
jgi:predicted nucleic acid-binding protein